MKKTFRIVSILLTIALLASLSVVFLGCDNNKEKTEAVATDSIDEIFESIIVDTKDVDNFRYQYKCDEIEDDIYVMKVKYNYAYVQMAYGVKKDHFDDEHPETLVTKTLLYGDYYMNNGSTLPKFAHDELTSYTLTNNIWEKDTKAYEGINDLSVYDVLVNFENYLIRNTESAYSFATCDMTKTTKNGKVVSYQGSVTLNSLTSFTFTTVEYKGQQVLASLNGKVKLDESSTKVTEFSATYTYGTRFDIPVVEVEL